MGRRQQVGGRRLHAEEIALGEAGDADLSDATMYVTMEPCNGNVHHSRQHCCEQIAGSGVGRVVMANRKMKYEGGADHLRENGVVMEKLDNDTINSICGMLVSDCNYGKDNYRMIDRAVSLRETARTRLGY